MRPRQALREGGHAEFFQVHRHYLLLIWGTPLSFSGLSVILQVAYRDGWDHLIWIWINFLFFALILSLPLGRRYLFVNELGIGRIGFILRFHRFFAWTEIVSVWEGKGKLVLHRTWKGYRMESGVMLDLRVLSPEDRARLLRLVVARGYRLDGLREPVLLPHLAGAQADATGGPVDLAGSAAEGTTYPG